MSWATNQPSPGLLQYAGMKILLPSGIRRGSTAALRQYVSRRDGPRAKRRSGGGGMNRAAGPSDQPPFPSGNVTAPRTFRQPNESHAGHPLVQEPSGQAIVGLPLGFTQPIE